MSFSDRSMSRRTKIRLGLAILGLMLISGCVYLGHMLGWQKILTPRIEFVGIKVGTISFTEINLNAELIAKNPNNFVLELAKIRYEGEALGQKVIDGIYETPIVLPAESETKMSLPAKLTGDGIALLLKKFMSGNVEDLNLVLRATLTFETFLGEIDVDIEEALPLLPP